MRMIDYRLLSLDLGRVMDSSRLELRTRLPHAAIFGREAPKNGADGFILEYFVLCLRIC